MALLLFFGMKRTKYLSFTHINSILGTLSRGKRESGRERERERLFKVIKIKVSSFSNEPSSHRVTRALY